MRAVWSGSLSFGLINIPVKLYSAAESQSLSFRMLRKSDNCPVGYKRICKHDGSEVPYEEIVKGYEYEKGQYVILDDEDFEHAEAKKRNTIDIVSFTDEKNIDPEYFIRPYFIEPGEGAEKAYVLLREAFSEANKAGIAKYVLRQKEYLGAVTPREDNVLMLNQMRFDRELRSPEELNIPTAAEYKEREKDMAVSLVNEMSEPFTPESFSDTYTQELLRIIEEKKEGRVPIQKGEVPTPMRGDDLSDLVDMLKKSIEEQKAKRK